MTEGAALAGLDVADSPERWVELGFAVDPASGRSEVGGVRVTLGLAPPGRGIVAWALRDLSGTGALDGLATRPAGPAGPGSSRAHPNGVAAVDHVVLLTPDLSRLASALAERGLGLTRRAEVRDRAMGFRRLAGGPILEVVEAPSAPATAFWGVTFAVADPPALDALAAASRWVGPPRPAVQPGRRIATVDREAGLSTRVAFIDPESPVTRR